jgi:hypothetical protein
MDQSTPEQSLRRLEQLVREWTSEPTWPDRRNVAGRREGQLRVAPSGAHLIQHGTAELPEAPENVSVIRCDAANGRYQLYSDERGVCRIYETSIQRWPHG